MNYRKTLSKNTRSRKLRRFPTRPYLSLVMKKHITLKAKINSALSLVELLVVIAVIAVIAAIAIPNIAGTREAAVAAQETYDQATIDRMASQVVALRGGTAPTLAELQTGVTVTNGTNVITFRLD